MKRIGVVVLVLPLLDVTGAGAQTPGPPPSVDRQMNVMILRGPGDAGAPPLLSAGAVDVDFMSMPIGIGGEPVSGAPYSAEAITEFVQPLVDGNRIMRQSRASVYRDAAGRTRREQGLAVLGNAVAGAGDRSQVQIHDPASGEMYLLDMEKRTAQRLPSPKIVWTAGAASPDAAGQAVQTATASTFHLPLPAPPGATQDHFFVGRRVVAATAARAATVEQLGKRSVEGVEAEGTRSTTVIAAGQIGNELPISIVSERWFSTELQVLVMSRQSDPRFGETTYRLINVVRSEPSADLFQVPSDFTIADPPAATPGARIRLEKK